MAAKNALLPIPLTSQDAGSFDSTFQAINTSGLPEACVMLRIVNASSKDVTVSFDGVTSHDYVLSDTTALLQAQNLGQPNNLAALFRAGTVIWIKGASGGTGKVYLAGYYQPTQ